LFGQQYLYIVYSTKYFDQRINKTKKKKIIIIIIIIIQYIILIMSLRKIEFKVLAYKEFWSISKDFNFKIKLWGTRHEIIVPLSLYSICLTKPRECIIEIIPSSFAYGMNNSVG